MQWKSLKKSQQMPHVKGTLTLDVEKENDQTPYDGQDDLVRKLGKVKVKFCYPILLV